MTDENPSEKDAIDGSSNNISSISPSEKGIMASLRKFLGYPTNGRVIGYFVFHILAFSLIIYAISLQTQLVCVAPAIPYSAYNAIYSTNHNLTSNEIFSIYFSNHSYNLTAPNWISNISTYFYAPKVASP